jgi:hypothetical protein
MKRNRRSSPLNIHESFSDIALLMLATFIFLLVTILITSKLAQENQLPKLKKEVSELQNEVDTLQKLNERLSNDIDALSNMSTESQMEYALAAASLSDGQGRKDFDLFIKGLKDLPGKDLHLMVDATGSMHGVSNFLIPVLRVIVIRSEKHLSAVTWFSDDKSQTYQGTMGEMFDQLMHGAPFIGSNETIGRAFKQAARNAPAPGAYVLIGDEPSTDRPSYFTIPSPVFTLPIGKDNPDTNWEYKTLAERTGGKMLHLIFK